MRFIDNVTLQEHLNFFLTVTTNRSIGTESGDMMREEIQEMFSDRKRFTPDSFKSGWMADLPDEDKEFLMHGDCDPEEFFADCDADSIDCSNAHSTLLSGNVDERFL